LITTVAIRYSYQVQAEGSMWNTDGTLFHVVFWYNVAKKGDGVKRFVKNQRRCCMVNNRVDAVQKMYRYLTVVLLLVVLVGLFPKNVLASDFPRLYGDTRCETSKAVAEKYNSGNVDNVVIATGKNYADALSISTLAGKLDAPILLVDQTVSKSQDALDYITKHMGGGKVWIAGGTGVVDTTFESKLVSMGISTERLAGYDRYETCMVIAEKVDASKGTPVFIASGENFPDALSVASVAAEKGYPIILTSKKDLSAEAKEYLKELQPSDVFIIGGTAVIPQAVESSIKAALPSAAVTRLAGQNRYDTSVEVYKKFFDDPPNIYIASGTDFADALSVSVLAAKDNAPVVLIDSRKRIPPESTISYLERLGVLDYSYDPETFPPRMWHLAKKQPNVTIIGGPSAVSGPLIMNIDRLTAMPLGIGRQAMQWLEPAPPETSGYPIPERHHFYSIEGSLDPSNPHQAELAIYIDFETDFEKQLKELEGIIQPILGPKITKEITNYMKTKTNRNVGLDKWWETDKKKINVGSGYGDYIIEFLSWRK
jgi:putative cell wall-binding protein